LWNRNLVEILCLTPLPYPSYLKMSGKSNCCVHMKYWHSRDCAFHHFVAELPRYLFLERSVYIFHPYFTEELLKGMHEVSRKPWYSCLCLRWILIWCLNRLLVLSVSQPGWLLSKNIFSLHMDNMHQLEFLIQYTLVI